MCEFVSYIEIDGVALLLRDKDIKSSRGKKLHNRIKDDIRGHGAIREYFGIKPGVGVEREFNDFTTTEGMHPDVVEAIKRGEVKLTANIWRLGRALKPSAWVEYKKVRDQALAEYEKVRDAAWAERRKVSAQALAECRKVRDPALAEYNKVRDPALAEYRKVSDQALAEYRKVSAQALAECRKVSAKEFWRLWANPENRIECWR